MEKTTIIVRTTSSNLWWGIYGFCEKIGWEDLNLFYGNEERIGRVCLNGKGYLREGLDDWREESDKKEFIEAVEKYLRDDQCHFWYYYDDKNGEDFYEVSYNAPQNDKGVKPRYTEIWHPDEGIGISTIETGVQAFAKQHLGLESCEIDIQHEEAFEASLQSFSEHNQRFGAGSDTEIIFADELVQELSQYWKKSKEEVLKKLKKAIS